MSSVQLEEGGPWYKKCMKCGQWTDYADLMYEPPSEEHPYGLDICGPCATPTAVEQTFVKVEVS